MCEEVRSGTGFIYIAGTLGEPRSLTTHTHSVISGLLINGFGPKLFLPTLA